MIGNSLYQSIMDTAGLMSNGIWRFEIVSKKGSMMNEL